MPTRLMSRRFFSACLLFAVSISLVGAGSPLREANVSSLRKLGFVPQASTLPGDGVKMSITTGTLKQLETLMNKGKMITIDEQGKIEVK